MNRTHRRILLEVSSLPTAPLAEHRVARYIRDFCKARPGLELRQDRWGNLLVRYHRRPRPGRRRPLFVAHMDHPGFIAERMCGPRQLHARWYGSVERSYFNHAQVRFWNGNEPVAGRISSIHTARRSNRPARPEAVMVSLSRPVSAGSIGMWDLPDVRIRGSRLRARACDDLAGVAALLCMLELLWRRSAPTEALCLFTRAEEVGFAGAVGACQSRLLPPDAAVISVECSGQLPTARLGAGPVLRVGDRMMSFSPELTAHCGQVAAELASRSRRFLWQRALLDRGTCEATAFGQFGYHSAALALPLGNYHNQDVRRRRIGLECIDLGDFDNLVRWLATLAQQPPAVVRASTLRRRVSQPFRRFRAQLARTARSL